MTCRFWWFAAALSASLLCFPLVVAIADEPSAASSEAPVKTLSAKDVEFALSGKTDLQLVQHPLYQFANECEQRLAIDVEIDTRALADAGIDPETSRTAPVSITSSGSMASPMSSGTACLSSLPSKKRTRRMKAVCIPPSI
jgi:hypothetical protein